MGKCKACNGMTFGSKTVNRCSNSSCEYAWKSQGWLASPRLQHNVSETLSGFALVFAGGVLVALASLLSC